MTKDLKWLSTLKTEPGMLPLMTTAQATWLMTATTTSEVLPSVRSHFRLYFPAVILATVSAAPDPYGLQGRKRKNSIPGGRNFEKGPTAGLLMSEPLEMGSKWNNGAAPVVPG